MYGNPHIDRSLHFHVKIVGSCSYSPVFFSVGPGQPIDMLLFSHALPSGYCRPSNVAHRTCGFGRLDPIKSH